MINLKALEKISIHPKLSAVLDLVMGVIFLFGLKEMLFNWWFVLIWFVLRGMWWSGLVFLTFYTKNIDKIKHLIFLNIFNLGLFTSFLFLEWGLSKQVITLLLIIGPSFSFYLLPDKNSVLSYISKPYRRWLLILTVAGMMGIFSSVGAVFIFKVSFIPKFVWILFTSVITSVMSIFWWQNYGLKLNKKMVSWGLVMFLIIFELSWVLSITPIGFLIFGLILVWLWYLLWLMVRFHLSHEGIIWKKQIPFLLTNLGLFLIFIIFVVQWI